MPSRFNLKSLFGTLAALMLLTALLHPEPAACQEQFARNIEHISFVPKGQWITGLSVNYTQSRQNDYQFLIAEDLNGSTYSFKVSPMVMYAVADNLAVGGRLAYQRNMNNFDSGTIKIDSETGYDIDHLNTLGQNFYAMGAARYYISLGNNTRFALFNEMQLELGGGESKILSGSLEDFTGTMERNFQLSVGLAPGMVMFLNNYSAIEVNVGVLGFDYTRTKAVTDRIYESHRNSKNANFKVNLFSISFGVAFYL